MHRYYLVNKPYEMLSQFVGGSPGLRMLGELDYTFPEGIHAIGRLDYHSEGLLLLTTNSKITKLLFESKEKHRRSYLVQAYKAAADETLQHLRDGVNIRIKGGDNFTTTPCNVEKVDRPEWLEFSPHELRQDIPQTWIVLTLTEGKFRQVRKMLSAVRHKCQRLVRISIEEIDLGNLKPGDVREINEEDFFNRLHLKPLPAKL